MKKIGEGAFDGCESLESVIVPSPKMWLGIRFGCAGANPLENGAELVAAGEAVTSLSDFNLGRATCIPDFAFSRYSSLESVAIPEGVREIGEYAFWKCSSLESVSIPGSVKKIGKGAFESCESLELVTIPDGVREIGESAFAYTSLKLVTIPESVTEVRDRYPWAFSPSHL